MAARDMELNDYTLAHLRAVVDLPDLSGTRYELQEEIGRGGLGVVYAARDRQLERRVAIKVLDSTLPRLGLEEAPRLEEEARVIASLEHPAIVPIYETGTLPDGRAYYAMKLVAGQRLDRYLHAHARRGPDARGSGLSRSERLRLIQRT